jgi:hypothetical protein
MTLKEAGEALVSFVLYDHFKMGNCAQGQSFFFAFHITASRDLSRCLVGRSRVPTWYMRLTVIFGGECRQGYVPGE